MTLKTGTRLGPFEITAPLGAGGMGEVYRATDTRLRRDVAIKVLPDDLAHDMERLARFEREARLLASLNHPSIASIYGLEDNDGRPCLVMELVEGQTLAQGIAAGPLPLEEALTVARRIAEALEAAHEKGIIHRDLKPANVMMTPEGDVKILDFGLAKALEGDTDAGSSVDASLSPTLTVSATRAGVVLGTAAYMSPEQARGKKVDRRADIWAFGVVLWEMLTGQQMFVGETVTDTLAAVLTREIDPRVLPPDVPEHVRWVLKRCLVRDPKLRLRDIGEARVALTDPGAVARAEPAVASSPGASGSTRWKWIAGFLLLVVIALVTAMMVNRVPPREARYLTLPLPAGTRLALRGIQPGPPSASPDGRSVAFVAEDSDGTRHIWIRDLGAPKARMIPDTKNASYPFWSWDGADIAFFADQKLKRVPAAGGSVMTITDAQNGKGGAWSRNGVILFCPVFNGSLYKVAASGGTPEQVTTLDVARGDSSHRFPQFMDDGRHYLYLVRRLSDQDNSVMLGSLDSDSAIEVVRSRTNALAVGDILFYIRDETLVARGFHQATGAFSGDPLPLAEKIKEIPGAARMIVAAAAGILVYQSGTNIQAEQLTWVDRTGDRVADLSDPAAYSNPRLSPDGRRIAIEVQNPVDGTEHIWLIDIASGNRERFTFETGNQGYPVWSPDGRRITYNSNHTGPYQIYAKEVDGTSESEVIVANDDIELRAWPEAWSSQGDELIYVTSGTTSPDSTIWSKPLEGGEPVRRLADSTFRFPSVRLSPDGRWLVFGTGIDNNLPGSVVIDFPDARRRWEIGQVSNCFWSTDGSELLCIDQEVILVSISARVRGNTFEWGAPQGLFRAPSYSLMGDGGRFLLQTPIADDDSSSARFELILNWESLVRTRP